MNTQCRAQGRFNIFVSHPERQHSHQLASALAEANALGMYIYGSPLTASTEALIPPAKRRQLGYCRVLRALLFRLLPARTALSIYYRLIWSFDALMARRLRAGAFDGVVGYENAALHEFRAARGLGIACILDNSGVHHRLQDQMLPRRLAEPTHRKINARKEEELALADLIITCSSFAAQSFIASGIPAHKVRVAPLGCDTDIFSPPENLHRADNQPIKFLFVGRLQKLKGADLLAQAARKLKAEGILFELIVAASLDDADESIIQQLTPVARMLGKVPHAQLSAYYSEADCLLVPSRFDSFAMVVTEAFACGLPVIVSENVGAKDMVEDGINGWVVAAHDATALMARMRSCALEPSAVRNMRPSARATTERWSWKRYRSTVGGVIQDFMMQRTIDRASAGISNSNRKRGN